jgi:hypothetical protein
MAPQQAKKAESGEEEHDPVDFPEAPAASEPAPAKPASASDSPAASTPVPESVAQEATPGPAETNKATPASPGETGEPV